MKPQTSSVWFISHSFAKEKKSSPTWWSVMFCFTWFEGSLMWLLLFFQLYFSCFSFKAMSQITTLGRGETNLIGTRFANLLCRALESSQWIFCVTFCVAGEMAAEFVCSEKFYYKTGIVIHPRVQLLGPWESCACPLHDFVSTARRRLLVASHWYLRHERRSIGMRLPKSWSQKHLSGANSHTRSGDVCE